MEMAIQRPASLSAGTVRSRSYAPTKPPGSTRSSTRSAPASSREASASHDDAATRGGGGGGGGGAEGGGWEGGAEREIRACAGLRRSLLLRSDITEFGKLGRGAGLGRGHRRDEAISG